MFPIALDLRKVPILLIGEGEAFFRRKQQLEEYGAEKVIVIESSSPESLTPNPESRIIMIAGLPRPISEKLASEARTAGRLVNVEDMNDLCDFYFTANIKHGDLLIAVSTGGCSPTLARRIRDYISRKFGAEWAGYVREMADFRAKLKAEGKNIPQVLKESDRFLEEKGWLNE